MKKKLTIAIPCYEMNNNGLRFLKRLLYSISTQKINFNDIEVIISDHSIDNKLRDIIDDFKFPIIYIKNEKNRGSSSANINNCIKHSNAEYIKPIFQDDFLIDNDALQIIIDNLDVPWLAHTYNHYDDKTDKYYNERIPYYNFKMIEGINTIGPPTCIAFKNDNNYFDEKLIWFMDTEFYHRLNIKYGEPRIIKSKPLISNTTWFGQITNTKINDDIISREKEYLESKRSQSDSKILNLKNHQTAAIDIREHLDTLQRYASNSDSIVEMGVRSIISTWAFLAGKPETLISIDISHPSNYEWIPGASKLQDVERIAKDEGIDFRFILGDSREVEIPECDLLFIDTLHTYDQIKSELSKHACKVKKWIILHDTSTFKDIGELEDTKGIWQPIEDFINSTEWYIKEQYMNDNGLTILAKRGKNDSN